MYIENFLTNQLEHKF